MTSEGLSFEQQHEVERLLTLANLQRMRGQWTDAEDTCRKALEITPRDAGIHEVLGDILHECGKLDKTLEEYRAATEISPGKPVLETKYAKVTLEIAERAQERAIAQDMIQNPHKYTVRPRNPVMALVSSALVPGLGQLYNGDMIKAGVLFGVFIAFVIALATLSRYNVYIRSISDFWYATNPVVQVLGFLAFISYIYGLIDAPISANKVGKAARRQTEP